MYTNRAVLVHAPPSHHTAVVIYQINLSESVLHAMRHAKEQIDMFPDTLRKGISMNIW